MQLIEIKAMRHIFTYPAVIFEYSAIISTILSFSGDTISNKPSMLVSMKIKREAAPHSALARSDLPGCLRLPPARRLSFPAD
jgi:hypothetical protein